MDKKQKITKENHVEPHTECDSCAKKIGKKIGLVGLVHTSKKYPDIFNDGPDKINTSGNYNF
jgi:hypothetical protein